jgi:acyl-coenzyme A thioesterase PaaI-like protein
LDKAMSDEAKGFSVAPDPAYPGWLRWRLNDPTRYNEAVLGTMLIRTECDDTARVRIFPAEHLTNNVGNVHGAATLGLIDIALFAACKVLRGIDAAGSVTLGIETQFIGAGDPAKPLDAVVEVLRETGRMVFLRGLVVQDDTLVASFSATTKKPPRK